MMKLCLALALGASALQPRTRLCRRATAVFGSGGVDLADAALAASLSRAAVASRSTGHWAGWEVAFNTLTGHAEPLDDAYVPMSLREYGETPLGWEVFSHERTSEGGVRAWERTSYRVQPEAGCAADEVAVSASSSGVDVWAASVSTLDSGATQLVDSARYPSGETTQQMSTAPPFVEVRTLFYVSDEDDDDDGLLARFERVRVELKFDPSCASLLRAVVIAERRVPDGASTPPFSSRARPGSSRAAGLDATSVAQACGKIFVSPQSGDAEFRSDGSTSLELADGTVRVSFGPLADRADGSYLYVELPRDGKIARRNFDTYGRPIALWIPTA